LVWLTRTLKNLDRVFSLKLLSFSEINAGYFNIS
jgi:hypothetical protein